MKPALRPMSFTSPMPLGAPRASVWAQLIASRAFSIAVPKPNERYTKGKSLSIVLGMPTTAIWPPAAPGFDGDRQRAALRAVAADAERAD